MGSFGMHNVIRMCIGKKECKLMPVEMYLSYFFLLKLNSIYEKNIKGVHMVVIIMG